MPDDHVEKHFSGFTQQGFLYYAITDDEACGILESVVPTWAFDTYEARVYEAATEWRKKYGSVVGDDVGELFVQLKKRYPKGKDALSTLYRGLRESAARPPVKAQIFERAKEFLDFANVRGVHEKLTVGLEQYFASPTPEKLKELINVCGTVNDQRLVTGDSGLHMADPKQALSFLTQEEEESTFLTGIKEIDDRKLGPKRGNIHMFVSNSGKGKSWWLANLAIQNAIKRNASVGIITFEDTEVEYMQRLNMALFGIAADEESFQFTKFSRDENGLSIGGIERKTIEGRRNFDTPGAAEEMSTTLKDLKLDIRIKSMPDGEMEMSDIEAQLTLWEWKDKFVPGLLLIDYLDCLTKSPTNAAESTAQIFAKAKGLTERKNFAMATVSQTNAAGENAKLITGASHVAEGRVKYNKASRVLSFNQTDKEHKLGVARLFQCKGRGRKDRFQLMISQSYAIGQFAVDSVFMDPSAYANIVQGGGDES